MPGSDQDYLTLGLAPGASPEAIEQAHRELVAAWNPDRFADAPRMQPMVREKLQEINTAYDRLMALHRKLLPERQEQQRAPDAVRRPEDPTGPSVCCPRCGGPSPAGSYFCILCGEMVKEWKPEPWAKDHPPGQAQQVIEPRSPAAESSESCRRCTHCQASNPPEARFCRLCGSGSLEAGAAGPPTQLQGSYWRAAFLLAAAMAILWASFPADHQPEVPEPTTSVLPGPSDDPVIEELVPSEDPGPYSLITLLYNIKRYNEAVAQWQEELATNPKSAQAHNHLGTALAELRRYDEAIAEFQQAIRLKHNYADPHYKLGTVLSHLQQYDEAVVEFREALRLDPNDVLSHYKLGNALRHLKEYDKAAVEYREALRFNPNHAHAHYYLGYVLGKQDRWAEAVREWNETLRIDPYHPGATKGLPRARARMLEEMPKR